MKKLITLITLSSFIFLMACDDQEERIFITFEEQIDGQWVFDRVRFEDDWTGERYDLTDEYFDFVFDFYPDNFVTLEHLDAFGELTYLEGTWERDWVRDCRDCRDTERLIITFDPVNNGLFGNHIWEIETFSPTRLRTVERVSGGRFFFRLERLN